MALCGIAAFHPVADGCDSRPFRWSSVLGEPSPPRFLVGSPPLRGWRARCSLGKIASGPESRGAAGRTGGSSSAVEGAPFPEEEEVGPVIKFKMSDFAVSDQVSVGLQGRLDEVIFEATVRDPESPLYNSRVVLRQLTSMQARRRGRRALEVLKKLAPRRIMYHSYAMQVHGYVSPSGSGDDDSFTLVHGYHGSYSLRHWLQLSDWLPTLEATLALDEEYVRRVGDDTVGGPAVTRQLRLTRILMRDLLIGVNYLHSHGLAHTELRLENVHISPVDKHVKVGILGNAVDFFDNSSSDSMVEGNTDRRRLMIAFDMRCVGFIMAKLVLRELMDASVFLKFKSFLNKGNNPSCLREFLLPILCRDSPSGNAGLQMLDRNWGAGWNLLSLLLATKPSARISCLDALRHPFLCGPRWRVRPSMHVIRWGLGSTAVRMAEDYIYGQHQRSRISYFIELMELLNPHPRRKSWLEFLPGRWRLVYSTGRHIGLTLRQPSSRVLIGNAYLTFTRSTGSDFPAFSIVSDISFKVMPKSQWPHDKAGAPGSLDIKSSVRIAPGRRFYLKEETEAKWKRVGHIKEPPSSLPAVKLLVEGIDISMRIGSSSSIDSAKSVLHEVRTQIPPEMFDVSELVCGTYVDSRMMVLRGVNGSALLFTRSCLTTT
ncbi:probable plastid-lipid-associated protein 14, chloroplastic [Phoenix dactylifera]|uniref:Probable plastid-lipid-associated protein 14, chloroplastic n=1 Tax=Phoenix dactylifera TaxID=42345 RepID=A0A8B7CFV8_PHODC|nr:probable plastid-lipid-associated protein 14, chloroplastic [Phoenix dactylifera]